MDLKSWRQTLQECLEDDVTGRGSGGRLAMILGTIAQCFGLVFALAAHAFMPKDFSGIIEVLVFTLTGGAAVPYTAKSVMQAFKRDLPKSTDPGVKEQQ